MKRIICCCLLVFIQLFFISQTLAGKDPIGWRLLDRFPRITTVFNHSTVRYIFTNNLPFTMPTPLQVGYNASNNQNYNLIDECSGRRLTPKSSCEVAIVLYPLTAGLSTIRIKYGYGKNMILLPPLSTTVVGNNGTIISRVEQGLPPTSRVGSSYNIRFAFINTSSRTFTNLTYENIFPAGFTRTPNSSNCGSALAGNSTCYVTGTFVTSSTTTVTVAVTMNYGSGSVTASTFTKGIVTNGRLINFVNNCPSTIGDITLGISPGAYPGNVPCNTNSDCQAAAPGTVCNLIANPHICFYQTFAPVNNNYILSPGDTALLILPYVTTNNVVWNGGFAGRTGCTGTLCQTAGCNQMPSPTATNLACDIGFATPSSQIEVTLQNAAIGPDFYDLTYINGVNIPLAFTPDNPTFVAGNATICTASGATSFNNPAYPTNCNYNYQLPTNVPGTSGNVPANTFLWVTFTNNGVGCTGDSQCAAGTHCGLSTQGAIVQYNCGTQLGYWTEDEICGIPGGNAIFNCSSVPPGGSDTLNNMLGCAGSAGYQNSCYSNGAVSPCCGCVDWNTVIAGLPPSFPAATPTPPNNGIQTCNASDTGWLNNVYPGLLWLKTACATAYTYPYDDEFSKFTCQTTSSSGENVNDYTVTFCPGGRTGRI